MASGCTVPQQKHACGGFRKPGKSAVFAGLYLPALFASDPDPADP
jgi:hypothetical protein